MRILLVEDDAQLGESLEAALRAGEPPVVALQREGALCLDLRCVLEEEEEPLLAALVRAGREMR